jgi:quercetin dioxygenase-like cupin family protein
VKDVTADLVDEHAPLSRDAAEALAGAASSLPPVSPSPSVRERLLETLRGVDRFAPFFEDLVRLFQLPLPAIRRLLARIDSGDFESTLLGRKLDGSELFHFAVGPDLAGTGAAGGVVRIRGGVTFPAHRHHGDETTYVLEGGYLADGRLLGPGSVIEMRAGSEHDYRSAPGRDLVLAVLHRGIAFVGDGRA